MFIPEVCLHKEAESRLIDADGFLMVVFDKQLFKRLQTMGRIFWAVVLSVMFNGLSKNAA